MNATALVCVNPSSGQGHQLMPGCEGHSPCFGMDLNDDIFDVISAALFLF